MTKAPTRNESDTSYDDSSIAYVVDTDDDSVDIYFDTADLTPDDVDQGGSTS